MVLDFSVPKIMGILNITPDSFSDGGQFLSVKQAIARLHELITDGVDIIDVGGESTGPGSADVSSDEELKRVKPIIDYIAEHKFFERTIFSIDTYKASIAEYALTHGFQIVNDVTALRGDLKMTEVLSKYQPYLVLMYSKDSTARTTKTSVEYTDVIDTINQFLLGRIALAKKAGLLKSKIIIDPGMGMFVSANPKYSYEIIDRLAELKSLGCPILVGPSRKSFLGADITDRDEKSWQIARQAIRNGASIVRMHTIQKL